MYPDGIYVTERLIEESASAIICFILVYFMMKPYKLTREGSYLGLPLGFGFLGLSYLLSAFQNSPINFNPEFIWLPFLTKTFAFVFIAAAYIFSGKKSRARGLIGTVIITLLVITLTVSILLAFIVPQLAIDYTVANKYLRILNVVCLTYVAFLTLRSHIRNPDPITIRIPLGFIFLAISQYSLLFWYSDSSLLAFRCSVFLRFIGLGIFLYVAYQSFYKMEAG